MKIKVDTNILLKLQQLSLFKDLDIKVIEELLKVCEYKKYKKGKIIIKEGDIGDELFIIIGGEIEIVKLTLQNEPYTVVVLDAHKVPVYVGELAMIDRDTRSATVIARTDCECLILKRNDFLSFGDSNPSVGLRLTRAIAMQLAQRLRRANEDIITLFSALVEEISSQSL